MSIPTQDGQSLLEVARQAIDFGLLNARPPTIDAQAFPECLREHRASFVTLKLNGRLRGCMGSLTARQPAVSDVSEHAFIAGFRDPRFAPVTSADASKITISVSLLSPSTSMEFEAEAELLAQLRPHIDGLIIASGLKRATFLPAVWESLPAARDFLAHLKQKANFTTDDTGYKAWRYTVDSID